MSVVRARVWCVYEYCLSVYESECVCFDKNNTHVLRLNRPQELDNTLSTIKYVLVSIMSVSFNNNDNNNTNNNNDNK